MPLGLLSLGAALQQNQIRVKIYRPRYRLIKPEDYRKAAADILKSKPGLIGFSTWCITYPASLLVAREIKALAPGIPVVFGGPQASILPVKTLEKFPFVDFVLAGEADRSFPRFVEKFGQPDPDFSTIPGLTFRNAKGTIIRNRLNGAISNMDELPLPAYHLVPRQKSIKLDVGRGCPFKCTYCTTNDFFSKKYRVKSPERIVDEMITVYQKTGIRSFSFAHDMFTLDKKFVFELCEKLIGLQAEKKIEFKWTCSARIDCVSGEMLVQMRKAGCRSIFFGIETGSEKMQKSIRKNLDVSKAAEYADLCRRIGLNMHVSYIIGFPDETPEDVEQTLRSILQLGSKGAFTQASELALLPGTPLFKKHMPGLKFDGRFSSFSQAICGKQEVKLIHDHPDIFSSFYYLPVKTMSRAEIHFLCACISRQSQFRNTLFLLSDFIGRETAGKNLLGLFRSEFAHFAETDQNDTPPASHWIRVLQQLIDRYLARADDPFIYNVFSFEAYSALLKALYSRWQLVHPPAEKIKPAYNALIKPTPVWKMITTSYKLEKILPAENNWEDNKNRVKRGTYRYLLVAGTGLNCKRIKINANEVFLLENLSELSVRKYVKRVKPVLTDKEIFLWIRKMQRLGVVELSNPKIE